MEGIQDRVDIERLKGTACGQSTLLMPDIESTIVEPDIGFYGYGTHRESAVEGHISPVVVMTVYSFLWLSGLASEREGGVVRFLLARSLGSGLWDSRRCPDELCLRYFAARWRHQEWSWQWP